MDKALRLSLEPLEPRVLLAATVVMPLDDVNVFVGDPATVLDLANRFDDPAVTGTTLRVDTTLGDVDIELYDAAAPQTVANFLNYVNGDDYWSSLIHRLVAGTLLQMGGYWYPEWSAIPADPPVANEPGISNTRGTLAMWKPDGQPDGATSQFFINLADNSATFDVENGGYTVFGHVLGSGMDVVDAIAALPTYDITKNSINFPEIPLRDFGGPPAEPGADNVVLVNDITSIAKLTLSVSTDNPALLTPTLAGNTLTLEYAAGQWGSATVTVRATDLAGTYAEDSFLVTVQARPLVRDDAAITDRDQAVEIDVLANDAATDEPIDPTTVAIGTGPTQGQVAVNPATGVVTYTPDPGTYGTDTFTYTVRDVLGKVSGIATVEVRVNAAPVLAQPVPDQRINLGTAEALIPLGPYFSDPDYTGTVVRFDTVLGQVFVELYDLAAPGTVANFLKYVDDGDYASTIIHRVVVEPTLSIVQGGGIIYPGWGSVPTDPPIANEFGISNTRGTIAMAKQSGDPDSATSQWFFNVADNSPNLDNQNGGFTVFGHVILGSMSVVDALAAVPTYDYGSDPWRNLPLINFTDFPNEPAPENVVMVHNIVRSSPLTFALVNDNPALLAAEIVASGIRLQLHAGQTGSATLTVRATDERGLWVEDTFIVEVQRPPVAANDTATAHDTDPLPIAVAANDSFPDRPFDPASVVVTTAPTHGTAIPDPATGAIVYTANPGYLGPDTFAYTVADTGGWRSQAASVAVNVNAKPLLLQTIGNVAVEQGGPNTVIDLAPVFRDVEITGTLARFSIALENNPDGTRVVHEVLVELYDAVAPLTVANFLNYVRDGDYASTIIHRVVVDPTPFVVQGGGYSYPSWSHISEDAPVANEYSIPNTRGTLAMAKLGGDPDSATCEWFFNLADNTESLGPTNNGGYTVFGHVLGDGMAVVDAIAAVPVFQFNQPYESLPLIDYTTFPSMPQANNVILVNNITASTPLTYTVTSDLPGLFTPIVSGTNLTLAYADGAWGTANVTVRATDLAGGFVETTFQVTVIGPPLAVDDAPTTDPGVPLPIAVLDNDTPQGRPIDPTTVALVSLPTYGTAAVDPATGVVTYTPPANFVGPDPFTYSVRDVDGRLSRTATVNVVVASPGFLLGTGNPTSLRYTDSDGTQVTVSVYGGRGRVLLVGFPQVVSSTPSLTVVGGTQVSLYRIEIVQSTAATSLSFSTLGGTTPGAVFGGVVGSSPVGALNASTMDLTGEGIVMSGNGYILNVVLRDVRNGADIIMPATGVAAGIGLTVRHIADPGTNITLGSHLRLLSAAQWVGSTLTAPWAANITILGSTLLGLPGNLGANIRLTGAPTGRDALVYARVAGQIAGGTWDIDGSVGSIFAGSTAAGWVLDAQKYVRSLSATDTLRGSLTAEWFGSVTAARALSAALTATGADAAGASLGSLRAPDASGATVDVPRGIRSIAVSKWTNGQVNAGWLTSLVTTSNALLQLAGDFEATLDLDGTGARGKLLASASIAGFLKTGQWDINGPVGFLSARGGASSWAASINGSLSGLSFGTVSDTAIAANGPVGSIVAKNWLGGSIWTHSINSLVTTAERAANIPGHFSANMTLTGQGVAAGRPTLASARIIDGMAGQWDVTGNVGSVTVGFIQDWTLASTGNATYLDLGYVTNGSLNVGGTVSTVRSRSWTGGTLKAARITSLRPEHAADLSTDVSGVIDNIVAYDWLAGTIKAGAVRSIAINGLLPGIYGDFGANLTLTGATGVTELLGSLRVARRILGGTWNVAGNIGAVDVFSFVHNATIRSTGNIRSFAVGAMDGVTIYAGVASGLTSLPDDAADFTADATIQTLIVRGVPTSVSPNSFINTRIAARTINYATIRNVRTDNGGTTFGIAAQTIRTLTWVQGSVGYLWPSYWRPNPTDNFLVRVIPA